MELFRLRPEVEECFAGVEPERVIYDVVRMRGRGWRGVWPEWAQKLNQLAGPDSLSTTPLLWVIENGWPLDAGEWERMCDDLGDPYPDDSTLPGSQGTDKVSEGGKK